MAALVANMADSKANPPPTGDETSQDGTINNAGPSGSQPPQEKEKDALWFLTDDAYAQIRQYKVRIDMGSTIGPSRSAVLEDGGESGSMGTFGCFLEIKAAHNPNWAIFGLTNYHVIRGCLDRTHVESVKEANGTMVSVEVEPKTGTVMADTDTFGFPNYDRNAPEMTVPVTSPPIQVHFYLRNLLMNKALQVSKPGAPTNLHDLLPRLRDEMAWREIFIDEGRHLFGIPYMASGMGRRSVTNGYLDWALTCLMPPERIGSNRVPDYATWAARYGPQLRPLRDACGMPLKNPSNGGLRGMQHGEPVFKVGGSTGATAGIFTRPKLKCDLSSLLTSFAGQPPTEEFAIVSGPEVKGWPSPPFADHGDSGSVVCNTSGEVVGLY